MWASYVQLLRWFRLWLFVVKSESLARGGVMVTIFFSTTLACNVLVARSVVVPCMVLFHGNGWRAYYDGFPINNN